MIKASGMRRGRLSRAGRAGVLLALSLLLAGGARSQIPRAITAAAATSSPCSSAHPSTPGFWACANPMTVARSAFTMTPLTGQLCGTAGDIPCMEPLAAGGGSNTNTCDTTRTEVYDPVTVHWVPKGSLSLGRQHMAASPLAGNRVLVDGGQNGCSPTTTDSAELFADDSIGWGSQGKPSCASQPPSRCPGPMNHARQDHTSTLLNDGRVLAAGGGVWSSSSYSITNTAEVYAPTSGTWTLTTPMPSPAAYQTATLLTGAGCGLNCNRVLVAGGYGSGGYALGLSSPAPGPAVLFDPPTNTWIPTGNPVIPVVDPDAILLPSGRVLMAGGGEGAYNATAVTQIYDPATGVWSLAGSMVYPRVRGAANFLAPLPDGKVLAVGGINGNSCYDANGQIPGCDTSNPPAIPAEIFDEAPCPGSQVPGCWSTTDHPNLVDRTVSRVMLLGCEARGGRVLLAGGSTGSDTNTAELYNRVPTVHGISRSSGTAAGGDSVTITGSGFQSGMDSSGLHLNVQFGGAAPIPVSSVNVDPNTLEESITVTAPAGSAGTVPVNVYVSGTDVHSPAAATASDPNRHVADSCGHPLRFTYTAPPTTGCGTACPPLAPTVTGLIPTHGPAAGMTAVTVSGQHLAAASSVLFGPVREGPCPGTGPPTTPCFVPGSDTSLTAYSPPGTAGHAVDVRVVAGALTSSASLLDLFTYDGGGGFGTTPTQSPQTGFAAPGGGFGVTPGTPGGTGFSPGAAFHPGAGFAPGPAGAQSAAGAHGAGFAPGAAGAPGTAGAPGSASAGSSALGPQAGAQANPGMATAEEGGTSPAPGFNMVRTGDDDLAQALTYGGGGLALLLGCVLSLGGAAWRRRRDDEGRPCPSFA